MDGRSYGKLISPKMESKVLSGWVQINCTVIPYVCRHTTNNVSCRLLPLAVVRYGARLLRDRPVTALDATQAECLTLTQKCLDANLDFKFNFHEGIELIDVKELQSKSNAVVTWLPNNNPFEHTNGVSKPHSNNNNLNIKKEVKMERDALLEQCQQEYLSNSSVEMAMDLSKDSPSLDNHSDQNDDDKCLLQFSTPSDFNSMTQTEPLDLSLKSNIFKEPAVPNKNSRRKINNNLGPQTPVQICPAMLMGRKIPCIVKGDVHYVLVETLRRAYFPQCSLRALMFMVNRTISPFVYDLNQNDIQAILSFCKNPTSLSRSTKVISFHDAKQILPMFKNFLKKVSEQRHARKSGESSPNKVEGNDQIKVTDIPSTSTFSPTSPPGQCDGPVNSGIDNFELMNIKNNRRVHTATQRQIRGISRKGRSRNLQEALKRIQNQQK